MPGVSHSGHLGAGIAPSDALAVLTERRNSRVYRWRPIAKGIAIVWDAAVADANASGDALVVRRFSSPLQWAARHETPKRGELVRERRRQRGLPLPIADKVLPFCAAVYDEPHDEDPAADASDCDTVNAPRQGPEARAESRVSEAWARLAAAEQAGSTRPVLEGLEEAYHAEVAAYRAALARESVCADFL